MLVRCLLIMLYWLRNKESMEVNVMSTLKSNKDSKTRNTEFRFIRVNGAMKKIQTHSADEAFKAAMRVRKSRKASSEKDILISGLTI